MSSVIGSQFISISHSGTAIFNCPAKTSIVGGIVVDLVSAPIPPGDYTLNLENGVGGIEIYLPNYVKFIVNDNDRALGSVDVHDGLGFWETMVHKVKDTLHLSNQIPDHAVAPPSDDTPVRINLLSPGRVRTHTRR